MQSSRVCDDNEKFLNVSNAYEIHPSNLLLAGKIISIITCELQKWAINKKHLVKWNHVEDNIRLEERNSQVVFTLILSR